MEDTKAVIKKRNSEKRKQKSRDAARCRRSKESEIFSDLMTSLPLETANGHHIDKATVIRLVISYLRLRNLFKSEFAQKMVKKEAEDNLILETLDGFVLVLTTDGDVAFISNNVCSYLGISQIDCLGQNIFDMSHPCDHSELREILSKSCNNEVFSIFIRLKCVHINGRSVTSKNSFKVLHLKGSVMKITEPKNEICYLSICTPIPHPRNIEPPLGTYIFLSKHSLDMKYMYADDRTSFFVGYDQEYLMGRSFYEFLHVQDIKIIEKAFKSLFEKGQSETGLYRFLLKHGGYIWVQTQATVLYNDKGLMPESVICLNFIVSEKQNVYDVYSSDQMIKNEKEPLKIMYTEKSKPVLSTSKVIKVVPKVEKMSLSAGNIPERPLPVTAKTFAPRTQEMNKGFLMFSDDDSGFTILNDDPDDLTHLAPTHGDVCVPLTTGLEDMINEFISPNSKFSSFIDDDKVSPLFDPYRDDSSDDLSPSPLDKSPDPSSLPSLCSSGEEQSIFIPGNSKLDMCDSDSDDLLFKAPYIPMNETEQIRLAITSKKDLSYESLMRTFSTFRSPESNGSSKEKSLIASMALDINPKVPLPGNRFKQPGPVLSSFKNILSHPIGGQNQESRKRSSIIDDPVAKRKKKGSNKNTEDAITAPRSERAITKQILERSIGSCKRRSAKTS